MSEDVCSLQTEIILSSTVVCASAALSAVRELKYGQLRDLWL